MSFQKLFISTFKKILPPLSQTEKEALEAGTVSWDGELMSGTPDWSKLFALKKPELTADEQAFLNGPVEEFCAMLDRMQINADKDLPPEAWDYLKKHKFFGLEIPKEYGGLGFSSSAHSAIVIKIASRNIAAAVTVMVPNSLGPGELIHEYGTQEQKDYYLPRLATGEEIPCFALTGPEAGSDAANIPDYGVVCKNDKGELGMRVTWEKRYITLGPVATLVGLAFKLYDPDNLLGHNKKDIGITVALVPRSTPGLEIGERHRPMDLPFMNGPNRGKDVFIPIGNIIGGAERAGQGWKMLMECLAVGRALSLPALATAGAKFSCYTTGAYSRVRKQFNLSIGKFEGIEEPLGRMAGTTYMMNAARAATLQMVDEGQRPAVPSAILKYHLTEYMRRLVNDAMDVHGGKAICDGPSNSFVDLYKGIPIAITVEGANIMTRNLIIFGQGTFRAHPYVLKEIRAVNEPDTAKAFKDLTGALLGHTFGAVKHLLKSFVFGITLGFGSHVPECDPRTARFYRHINRLSASFNLMTELSLATLGGDLKRRERTSARLGDVFSALYMASTTLWYYEKNGRIQEDLPLVEWACTHALHTAEEALDKLMRNHPRKLVGWLARPLVFPLGRWVAEPTDKLDAKLAELLRTPGAVRDRLTADLYKPTSEKEPLGVLERAFAATIETEALDKKLQLAMRDGSFKPAAPTRAAQLEAAHKAGVLSDDELALLLRSDALRRAVIMVDSFPQDYARAASQVTRAA